MPEVLNHKNITRYVDRKPKSQLPPDPDSSFWGIKPASRCFSIPFIAGQVLDNLIGQDRSRYFTWRGWRIVFLTRSGLYVRFDPTARPLASKTGTGQKNSIAE